MKILILIISILLASPQCIHEKIYIPPEYLSPPEHHDTHMKFAATGFSPLRIHLDFTYLTDITPDLELYLKGLAYSSANYFKAALTVQPITGVLTIPSSTVCKLKTPNNYMTQGVDADLIIFVRAVYDNDTYVAAARACMLLGSTNRPVIGELFFNTRIVKVGGYLDRQRHTLTTLHEMTHVLGFSSSLYELYINPNTNTVLKGHLVTKNVNGLNTTYLNIEPLTSIVREHFGCSSIEGAPLENEGRVGSQGSHWERKVFLNEFMTASDMIDSRVSKVTLGLLEATGWYKVDFSMADNYFFGKDKGCDFLRKPCMNKATLQSNFEEFCQPLGQQGCSHTGRGVGFCGAPVAMTNPELPADIDYWGNKSIVFDSFADNCPYYIQYSNTDCENSTHSKMAKLNNEYYGKGAKCFSGNISPYNPLNRQVGYCFKYHCEQLSGNSWQLVIEIGSIKVNCNMKGQVNVDSYKGMLNCPDPNQYCTTVGKKACPRGCMGKGICEASGTCTCFNGWEGDDCGISSNLNPGGEVKHPDDPKPVENKGGSNFFAMIIGAGIVLAIFLYMRQKRQRSQENMEDIELLAYNRAS